MPGECRVGLRTARQRDGVGIAGVRQLVTVAPHHPHVAGAIETAKLRSLRSVWRVIRVKPAQSEIVIEVRSLVARAVGSSGPYDASPAICRSPRRIGGAPLMYCTAIASASGVPALLAARAHDSQRSSMVASTGPGAARTHVEWATVTVRVAPPLRNARRTRAGPASVTV